MNFLSLSIKGDELLAKLNDYPEGLLFLILKIKNADDIIAKAFIYDKNAARKFVLLSLREEATQIPIITYPVFLTTLKWKYSEDADINFDFDPLIRYYLHPLVDRHRLVYYLSENSFPELLNKAQKGLTNDKFNDMDPSKKQEILDIIQKLVANSGGGSFNPIPPKLVP